MRSPTSGLFSIAMFVSASAILWAAPLSLAQMTQAKCEIPFVGKASGGTLVISDNLNRNCRFVAVETVSGESAESVAERLAQAIRDQNPFKWLGSAGSTASASGGTLTGVVGSGPAYMTAGTEIGLGIPAAPTSLTCNYDQASNTLHVQWRNPSSSAYDSVRVVLNSHNYDHRGEDAVPGRQDSYVLDLSKSPKKRAIEDLDIWVIGVSHNIPSNAAAVHVRGRLQEELFGIPFARGIAPNWTGWSTDGSGAVVCEMGQRDEFVDKPAVRRYNPVTTPDAKPFYQIIGTSGQAGGPAGIRRDFLGLTPGHAYKLTVRVSTLELTSESGNWSYSLHAVPYSAATTLTPEQMAGLAPLPDGSRGESAGLVAKFDAQRTTGGKYEECSTEIVVPPGADAIVVWLRFTSDKPGHKVAMDYARLEDLGAR